MKITIIIVMLAIAQCVLVWKVYFLNNRMLKEYAKFLSVNKKFNDVENGRNESNDSNENS